MQALLNFFIPIISFLLCILTASFLRKTSYFSFLDSRENRFRSLDGVRGFLALSVFFHHFVITYNWKVSGAWTDPPEYIFQNLGQVGVTVFFMITGFLFTSKITKKNKMIKWLQLYQSRVFRIIPLYLVALVIITLIVFVNSDYHLNVTFMTLVKQYIKWGVFLGGQLNDFSDTKLIIAGVDWTLKYEWLFYLSLPFVAFFIKKLKTIGVVCIITGSIILFVNPISIAYFSTNYMIYFCVGGLSSFVVNNYKPSFKITGKLPSTINLILILTAMYYPYTLDIFHVAVISSFFLLTLLGNDLYGVFSLRASVILGEISYSIYLLHGIILYVIFTILNLVEFSEYKLSDFLILMPLISIIVVVTSAITFLFIEKPCMDIGRKVTIKFPNINRKKYSNID